MLRGKPKSIYSAIGWFIARAIIVYAVLFWGWSYLVTSYMSVVTPIANKELQVLGVADITWMGPSQNPSFEVAVYHRDAAGDRDSLFDFKLESIRSHFPMLLALVLAMPLLWKRKIKAALFGMLVICVLDSLACVVILIWSYTFLPDHAVFTPFSHSAFRDGIVSFVYSFYNAIGVGIIPIVVWAVVTLRREDVSRYLHEGESNAGRMEVMSQTNG